MCKKTLYIILFIAPFLCAQSTPPTGSMDAFSNGVIAEEAGDLEEALKWYRRAGRLDTLSTEPWEKVMELSAVTEDMMGALEAGERILDIDPLNWRFRTKLVDLYLAASMLPEARIHLEELVMQQPDAPDNYINLARVYLVQDMKDDADLILEQTRKRFPDNLKILKAIGDLYMQSYNVGPALDVFNTIIRKEPDYLAAHLGRAIILEQTGHGVEAEESYREYFSREQYPKTEIILSYLGLVARQGDIDRAISECHEFLATNPNAPALHKRLAFLYLMQEKDDESLIHLEQAVTDRGVPVDPELYLYIADIYGQQGNIEAGKGAWMEYLPLNPGLSERIGFWEYMINYGDTASVMNDIDSLSRIYPDSAVFDFFMGTYYHDQGMLDSAMVRYERGLRREPENFSLRFALGDTYERLGLRKKAIRTFESLVELDDSSPMILNYLGYILADADTMLDRSRELLETAIQMDPHNGAYIDSYGWLLFREGDLRGALEFLKKAEKLIQADPVVYEHLGDVYTAMGKEKKAEEYYDRALEYATGRMFDAILKKKNSVR